MRYVYWDSVCFLGWLQDEADKSDACGQVLDECDAQKCIIVTSAFTLTEVLVVRGQVRIDPSKRDLVLSFFKRDYIETRAVTRRIAERARDIVWDSGIKPKDAVHVATALDASLAELHTFDRPLIGAVNAMGAGLNACHPHVRQGSFLPGIR